MHCWLGGGKAWRLANRSEACAREVRVRIPRLLRSMQPKRMDP
jgi:hypothetical protein